jgi:hypothetical protein
MPQKLQLILSAGTNTAVGFRLGIRRVWADGSHEDQVEIIPPGLMGL